jgi:hypothetical protein
LLETEGKKETRMERIYVFTNEQLLQALLVGGHAVGVIPAEDADAAKKYIEDGLVQFAEAANGGVLTMNVDGYLNADQAAQRQRASQERGTTPAPEKPEAAATDGPDPEKVKAALGASMDRPPTLRTIKAWTPQQRRKALKWARHPETDRPDFVEERAPRGAAAAAPAGPDTAAPAASDPAPKAAKANGRGRVRTARSEAPAMTGSEKPRDMPGDDGDDDDDDDSEGSLSEFFNGKDDESSAEGDNA